MAIQKFQVNKYLELKLEGEETVIYVNSNKFGQCKFLLLNIPIDEITSLDKVESIDEAAERLDNSSEPINDKRINNIPPEVEFWGHCSNLQVWAENNYDTRLIHRNMAFHLLHVLSNAGDPVAKNVLKEEIVKRFLSGHPSVMEYLFESGFINYLEIQKMCLGDKSYNYLIEQLKEQEIKGGLVMYEDRIIGIMSRRKKLILTELNYSHISPYLPYRKIGDISQIKGLEKLEDLKVIDINSNDISEIKGLENLTNLERLDLSGNKITEIKGLKNLVNLEELNLAGNKITEIKGLENLTKLKILRLSGNRITEFKELNNLVKLERLEMATNRITELKGLDNLEHLKKIDLTTNKIPEIKGLDNLINLKELDFMNNMITEIKGLDNLINLEKLNLPFNSISEIKGLDRLINLKKLNLFENPISEIKGLENLTNLNFVKLIETSVRKRLLKKFGTDGQKYVKYCKDVISN